MKSAENRKHRQRAMFGAAAGLLFVVVAAMAVAAAGCNGTGSANASSAPAAETKKDAGNQQAKNATEQPKQAETRTAEQVLKEMQAAYRKADRYGDKAQVHRHFSRDGETFEQLFLYSVAFERPNKLRLDCYDARVVCDGQHFFATVPHVPNVVMQVPAPEKLTPNDIVRDQQLGRALQETPVGSPLTLLMLMQDNSLDQMLQEAMAPPKLLPQETTDGRRCNRVELDTNYGKLTFWIDVESNTLVRLDMPPLIAKQWDQNGEKTTGLTISYTDAQLDPRLTDEAFKFEIPAGSKVGDSLIPIFEPTPAAARTEPANLKLTKLWTASDVKNPGNVLIYEQPDGSSKMLVIDGARAVVEFDGEGKVAARHDLDLPPQAIVTYLRSAVDKAGKRYFVASAMAQPQLYVFDENWQRVLSFPKAEDAPDAQLTNAVIADLAGDGTPELCVGYFGDIGLQGVSLDGNRVWRERSPVDVQPSTVTEVGADGKRKLLCTHRGGTVLIYSEAGKPAGEVVVPDRLVGLLVGADLEGTGKNKYCALGYSQEHGNLALGIELEGREPWIYDIPDGVLGRPVELLSAADINGDGTKEWLIVAPDSSIHILNAEGKPIDKFNNGAALCGLAATKLGDKQVLLVSSALDKAEGESHSVLEAWQVEPTGK